MDRTAIQSAVRSIAQITTSTISDADLTVFIDEGYNEIVAYTDWPWCYAMTPKEVTMIAGTTQYSLGADVKRVIAVINTASDQYALESVGQADWARRQAHLESTSKPKIFTFAKAYLHIWPPPATTDKLKVYHYEHPAFAAAGASIPAFDPAFHTLIVNWALHRLWEREEDFEKSDDYRARFEARLQRMVAFYNTQVGDMPKIYGERGGRMRGTNMPWLSDGALGAS
jgi:hypothetical protein